MVESGCGVGHSPEPTLPRPATGGVVTFAGGVGAAGMAGGGLGGVGMAGGGPGAGGIVTFPP